MNIYTQNIPYIKNKEMLLFEKYIYDETTTDEDRKVVITYDEYLEMMGRKDTKES